MKKQSRTDTGRCQSETPPQRHLPLVDILVDTQAELRGKLPTPCPRTKKRIRDMPGSGYALDSGSPNI